ncbi:MAG: hypothetical protein ACOY90_18240 [Candidatus Zhuqueibacterota bacterium]
MKLFAMNLLICVFLITASQHGYGGIDDLHGDQAYVLRGLHNGNNIQTHFFNYGMFGRLGAEETNEIHGEWPKGSGHYYFSKIVLLVGAEVFDVNGNRQTIISESHGTNTTGTHGSSGDTNPLNRSEWWTLTPLPGFANYNATATEGVAENSVAMSHLPWSWPKSWPDKEADPVDPGWPGTWNSLFAKGREFANADQESYFVVDDYHNREFEFYPDAMDLSRRGLGMRIQVRSLQWNNPLVKDVMFVVYDVKNIGTYNHNKVNFIQVPGFTIGAAAKNHGSEWTDDVGLFEKDERFLYFYDQDGKGATNFTTGWCGYTLFETPGNSKDGIDNDGDGFIGSGIIIDESMFVQKAVQAGDEIIITDYLTFQRSRTTMPNDTIKILFQDNQKAIAWPGKILEEIPFDNIDNNLNGIIDENNGALTDTTGLTLSKYIYVGRRAVDYFSGAGLDNRMIDERRDNNIDEDGDWNSQTDDIGLDGAQNKLNPDFGEGDGMPTSGYLNGVDTGLPGEPNIDKTDIDESDLIGMTAFYMDTPWDRTPLYNDEGIWKLTAPGTVYAPQNVIWVESNTPFMGSGYFPMRPDDIERFSGALIFGEDEAAIVRNKDHSEKAFKEDYHFFKAPITPEVTAVVGDKKVVLYWDSKAEDSFDPINGKDFEGYRIYRSTDDQWKDMKQVTNAYGSVIGQQPLVIFDLKNGIKGLSMGAIDGVQYNLGDDSGLQHTWVDTTVKNGITYFYAVVSYDRGNDSLLVPPTECSRQLTLGQTGEIINISENVVAVVPRAPAAGYVPASSGDLQHIAGHASGTVNLEMIDPNFIKDDHTYQVTFNDTVLTELATKSFTLTDITDSNEPKILLDQFSLAAEIPIVDGFQLVFDNPAELALDAARSRWSAPDIYDFTLVPMPSFKTKLLPIDVKIIFGERGIGKSVKYTPVRAESIEVNFKVVDWFTGEDVLFAFRELDYAADSLKGLFTSYTKLTRRDQIYLLQSDSLNNYTLCHAVEMATFDSLKRNPQTGDTLIIHTIKPFLSNDILEFMTTAAQEDKLLAARQLDKIRVVPNPYIVANSFEPANPYARGRGPRELHFTHLPRKCTIKIFDIRGQLINTIEHDNELDDGAEIWNMLTKDNMEIGFGIFIYYIDADEVGQRTGKFAVIK